MAQRVRGDTHITLPFKQGKTGRARSRHASEQHSAALPQRVQYLRNHGRLAHRRGFQIVAGLPLELPWAGYAQRSPIDPVPSGKNLPGGKGDTWIHQQHGPIRQSFHSKIFQQFAASPNQPCHAVEAGRHVGPDRQRQRLHFLSLNARVPQTRQQSQGSRRIGRSTANP